MTVTCLISDEVNRYAELMLAVIPATMLTGDDEFRYICVLPTHSTPESPFVRKIESILRHSNSTIESKSQSGGTLKDSSFYKFKRGLNAIRGYQADYVVIYDPDGTVIDKPEDLWNYAHPAVSVADGELVYITSKSDGNDQIVDGVGSNTFSNDKDVVARLRP